MISPNRFLRFRQLAYAYVDDPSITAYVRLRREFPEFESRQELWCGDDTCLALEPELAKHSIDPDVAWRVISPNEEEDHCDAVDELSLRLLECSTNKENFPKDVPLKAISPALINYLIALMLESMEWNSRALRVPSSLVVLVRHQLFGAAHPAQYAVLRSQIRKRAAALKAAERLQPGEKLTIQKLMGFAGIGQGTAHRYIKDPIFQTAFKSHRAREDSAAQGGAYGTFLSLEHEFTKHGIDLNVAFRVLCDPAEDNSDAIDELSLRLLECLIIKENIPKSAPEHVDNRRKAIGPALVNYLIVLMLEAMEANDRRLRVPSSLVVLVRHQLFGVHHPALYAALLSKSRKESAARLAAEYLDQAEELTVHKLMGFAGIGQGTAHRYIKDPIFQTAFEWHRAHEHSALKKESAARLAAEYLDRAEKLTVHKLMGFAGIGQGTAHRYIKDPIFQTAFKSHRAREDSAPQERGGVPLTGADQT